MPGNQGPPGNQAVVKEQGGNALANDSHQQVTLPDMCAQLTLQAPRLTNSERRAEAAFGTKCASPGA